MPADPSFFHNTRDITIENGSFNMSVTYVEQTTVRNRGDSPNQLQIDDIPTERSSNQPDSDIVFFYAFIFLSFIFPSLPAVQLITLYCLFAKNRRITPLFARPSDLVKVMDALGIYHDFPLVTCKELATFHHAFFEHSRNRPGFDFVISRSYDVQFDGHILQPEDWKDVQAFVTLLVDFVIIQQQASILKCPWCKTENPLPPSLEQFSDSSCICSSCSQHCYMRRSLQAETAGSSSAGVSSSPTTLKQKVNRHSAVPQHTTLCVDAPKATIPVEIRRIRVKLDLSPKDPEDSPSEESPIESESSASDTGATWDTPPVDLDRDECLKQQQNLDFLSVLSPTDIVTPHPNLFESDIDSNLAAFTDHLQLFTIDSNDAYNFFRTENPQWQGPLSTSSDSYESLSTYSESFYSEFSNYQRRANLNTDIERPFFDFSDLDMDFQRIHGRHQ